MGHIPVDVMRDHVDLLSLSGHKFHAPKGIGALYCRKNVPLNSLLVGGGQERGKRSGTEAVMLIAAMAAALEECYIGMEQNAAKVCAMRDRLIQGLGKIPGAYCNGDAIRRVPGIVNFCFEGIEGESLLLKLNMAGICAGTGSACASGSAEVSHVLLSMGIPPDLARGSLRISLCSSNTMEEVEYIIREVMQNVMDLRSSLSAFTS